MKFLVFLFLVAFCINIAIGFTPTTTPPSPPLPPHLQKLASDGFFKYGFVADNGFEVEAVGVPKVLSDNPPEIAETIKGKFSWTSPEGKYIWTKYVADEDGYHPEVHL